jgi:RND family efflux transporter MFP subunit
MTAPLADVLRHLRMLVGWSVTAGQTDAQLLERFIVRKEEAAFEELTARHGPMVLAACRQLLREPQGAEDAFQATFLVLVRRAASIGKCDQLAGWLYGVAHRVAARTRAQKVRQSQRERQGVDIVAVEPSSQTSWDDRLPAIHEEINRLPDKYRLPIVLCYLEGKTRQEAARDLGWTPSALKGRLERARERLRKRLMRRGVILSAAALSAIVLPQATALPPDLVCSTLKAATLLATGKSLAAGGASAQVISLIDGVLRTMFVTKLKFGAAVFLVLAIVGAGLALSVYRSSAAEQSGDDSEANATDTIPDDNQPARGRLAVLDEPTVRKVQVTHPISRKVIDYQDYPGRTEATSVQVMTGSSGELLKTYYRPGEEVKKGDMLFEVDPRTYRAELDKTTAEYNGAQARLRNAKTALQRIKDLAGKNVVDRSERDRAIANQDESQAALQAAKASLELAQLHLQSTRVTAPLTGRIGQPLVAVGSYVKAGTTMLATIVVTDPIYVNFDMDEGTFLRLRRQSAKAKVKLVGAAIQVRLADEDVKHFSRRGVIDFISNEVDPKTGTVRVRAALSNADQFLLPGLFVRIRLAVSAPHQAFLVPDKSILSDQGRKWLWIATRANTVERRYVELGPVEDDWWAVTGGLTTGDWVLVSGMQTLQPTTNIQPEPVTPTPPQETGDAQAPPAPPAPGHTKR